MEEIDGVCCVFRVMCVMYERVDAIDMMRCDVEIACGECGCLASPACDDLKARALLLV